MTLPLRVGLFPYLNVQPLIHGLSADSEVELVIGLPSRIADRFRNHELDLAMVPSFDAATLDPPILGPDGGQRMRDRGLGLVATKGTAEYLASFGVPVDQVLGKVQDTVDGGPGGNTAVDLIADGTIVFVVNTPRGSVGRSDGEHIRKAASMHRVSCVTTVSAALAAAQGLGESPEEPPVRSQQEYHAR